VPCAVNRQEHAAHKHVIVVKEGTMWFHVPHQTVKFEIPEAWLEAANAVGFVPKTLTYLASSVPD
jgi:hypothetical protein